MENKSMQNTSFRGKAIPEVTSKKDYQLANDKQVIDKISNMSKEQRNNIKIDAVHYDNYRVSEVKLSTGDIVPVETAIALTENSMLKGYTTGNTAYGGKTLRAKPKTSSDAAERIRDLPKF